MTDADRKALLDAAQTIKNWCAERYECAGCIFRRLNPYFQEHCALGISKKPSKWRINEREDEDHD